MVKPILATALALAAALLITTTAIAGPAAPRPVSAVLLGFDTVKNISAGFTTDAIDMQLDGGAYTRLSVPLTIVWGTTTSVELRLLGSDTESGTYANVTRCTSAAVHVCKPRRWQFVAADWSGLVPRLDFVSTRYRYLKVQVVAGSGTGTIIATATRAP